MKKYLILAILLCLSGCAKSNCPIDTSDFADSLNIVRSELHVTEKGVCYADIIQGTGEIPEQNDEISVNYTGWLKSGVSFDSSYERQEPYNFILAPKQVISGWEEGIKGMKVGGKRKLIIPSELAYGEKGKGIIPGNADLVFDIELLEIVKPKKVELNLDLNQFQTLEDGLLYQDEVIGDGQEATTTSSIKANYIGWLKTDGTEFDNSYEKGKPIEITLGQGQVILGWDLGIPGMKVGGKRKIIIEPKLAYGETGFGSIIPPNATLVFEIELVEVL